LTGYLFQFTASVGCEVVVLCWWTITHSYGRSFLKRLYRFIILSSRCV